MAFSIQNLPMRQRILLALLLTASIALCAMGILGYLFSRDSLETTAYNQLISIRENKKREIEKHFSDLDHQLKVLADNPTTVDAMRKFRDAFEEIEAQTTDADVAPFEAASRDYYSKEFLPRLNANLIKPETVEQFLPTPPAVRALQNDYITQNRNPTGEKHQLNRPANRNRSYDQVHEQLQPFFRKVIAEFEYYDLFLIEPETGHIVYTVFKEVDFATSLNTGPYAKTNFARAFRSAVSSDQAGETFLVDYERYAPSYGAPASFISIPIFDSGKRIGVLVVQVSINAIDGIMTGNRTWKESGLGESGETYLVGPDFRMRNNSRFLFEERENFLQQLSQYNVPDSTRQLVDKLNTTILQIEVRSDASQKAVRGILGSEIVQDYRNVSVLSAFCPVNIAGVRWALLSEIDEEEAFAPANQLRLVFLMISLLVALSAIGLAFWLSNGLTRPVLKIRDRLHELARGSLPERLQVQRKDEIGQMNGAANQLIDSFEQLVGFASKIEAGELEAPFEPRGPEDIVGTSIAHMRDGLQRSRAIEQEALEVALQQEEELRQQTEELRAMNDELFRNQNELQESNLMLRKSEEELEHKVLARTAELKQKTDEMVDSIQYARRIQRFVLPNLDQVRRTLPELFVFYRPRDIVSGDFYWFYQRRHHAIVVTADCTGHGVPGAFMSLLGGTSLNQIVRDFGQIEVHLLLAELNDRISAILKQGYTIKTGEVPPMDGMDIGVLSIDLKTLHVEFAGAGRPLYYFQNGELKTIKGDKLSIGGSSLMSDNPIFTKHELELTTGDQLYLFSDGITDQFNGEDTKKVGNKRLREWLEMIHDEPASRQRAMLDQLMRDWMGNNEQTDDMVLMGLRL